MASAGPSRSPLPLRSGRVFSASTSRPPGWAPTGRTRLADLIARLKGKLAIVAIEHDMEFLFRLADQISVVHWGQVIARGTPSELKANPWVQRSNLGRLQ